MSKFPYHCWRQLKPVWKQLLERQYAFPAIELPPICSLIYTIIRNLKVCKPVHLNAFLLDLRGQVDDQGYTLNMKE